VKNEVLMIAFLIALAPFIPALLSVAGFLIKMFGTSEANLKAFEAMVQKNKDAGLITVETYQRFQDFHQQMLQEYEAKQKQGEKK
jgi:hypothetical protein